jgi:hypothetical protein
VVAVQLLPLKPLPDQTLPFQIPPGPTTWNASSATSSRPPQLPPSATDTPLTSSDLRIKRHDGADHHFSPRWHL